MKARAPEKKPVRRRKLHASSAAPSASSPTSSPAGQSSFDPREASALYLMAKLRHLPEGADTALLRRLEENADALALALTHPFAREVARALRGERRVSPRAQRYADELVRRATPQAGA